MESTNNKLIAEFMKLPTEVFNSGIMNYHHDGAWFEEHELSYDVSWDWLMPVVEKCLTTGDRQHFVINDALLTCNIEEVYKAVVEFIKQYNDER